MAHLGRRAATVAVAATAALALAVPPASAEVIAKTDGVDTVYVDTDNPGDPGVDMSCLDGAATVNDSPALPVLSCADVALVIVDAEYGATSVDLTDVSPLHFPGLLRTSVDVIDDDEDVVTGSQGRDVVHADVGDTVTGGPGDDWVEGAGTASGDQGADVLRDISNGVSGGPGDDRIVNPGAGPISGGDGHDVVVADFTASPVQQPVNLVISDMLLGPAPGLGIESTGIEEYDVTTSTGARNDTIDSRAYSGVVVVNTLDGNDTIRGGPGADAVDGGAGNDLIDPGPGADVVRGGSGQDVISARDGVADSVDCGDGIDTVVADRADVLTRCENVSLPPPDTDPISGPTRVKKGHLASFRFGSPVAGAQFECALDGGAFRACESPFRVKTRKLRAGKHTLSVRAVQPAGNADPTPSTYRFKVLAKKHHHHA